ncbi:MAG: hypothetical protein IAG10_05475 [Planctomycetaceae bacterium]|nr:hypothetical protein [Planctomycetaceae bacterium]
MKIHATQAGAACGRCRWPVWRNLILLLMAVGFLAPPDSVSAQSAAKLKTKKSNAPQPAGPRDYRSANFLVHTDLPEDEANDLLKRLENMLTLISKYWGRPNKQTIEMFVVRDLEVWPPNSLEPAGRESIEQQAGITMTSGAVNRQTGKLLAAKSRVYAIADRGVPQHEAVHAYCHQMFGHAGPTWYAEGMAEMGHCWREGESRVHCLPIVVKYLRGSEPKPLRAIVDSRDQTGDSWQNYSWRWALCHLLANNPNYYDRFRPLGLGILTDQPDATFERVYGSMSKEIAFEYLFFLQHFDLNYEVTLTAWDWKTKFRHAMPKVPVVCTIEANRGWQASRLLVRKGEEFEFSADGSWTLAADAPELSPFGLELPNQKPPSEKAATAKKSTTTKKNPKTEALEELPSVIQNESPFKTGQLVGVLFNDYELSEPFEIPADGSFVAPGDGQLFLRCEDAWNRLADNKGKVNLKFKLKTDN